MQIGDVVSDDLVQAVTLVISLIGVALWLRWGRGRIGYAVAPISFLLHRAAFYIVVTLDRSLSNAQIVMWSSAISLHGAITIVSAAAMMIVIRRRGMRS